MKVVKLSIIVTVFVVCYESSAATISGSENLNKALEELRRRRRWLESGVPLDYDPSHHEYGTINHFTPDVKKRQLHWGPALSKAALMPLPDDEEDKRKKKSPAKRSFFRERQLGVGDDNSDRKRKRWESDSDYDDTWQESEAEFLKNLAQRRFLATLLGRAQQEQARQTNQIPRGLEDSLELDQMDEEDVIALIDLLKKQLGESAQTKFYMEGEGSESSEEDRDDLNRKKKIIALKKRLIWQDGIRYSLGDEPPSKRQYSVDEESGEEEPWLVNVDPRLLEKIEYDLDRSDEDDRKTKREPDPWFPAFDIEEKKRYYSPMSSNWAKRKRSTVFRERALGLGAGMESGKKKRLLRKRIPEEMLQKRIVKKSVSEPSQNEEKLMDELKTIMADEKSPKVRRRNVDDATSEEMEESTPDIESDESPLSDYFGYDRRGEIMRKRKRSWNDYIGIDKRKDLLIHDVRHEEENDNRASTTLQPEADHMKKEISTTKKPTVEKPKPEIENNTETKDHVTVVVTAKSTSRKPQRDEKNKRLSQEQMQRYFNSIAAAMSVKKKRASQVDSPEDLNDDPLAAMDRRLEAIENLMLEEALELVENNREPNDDERDDLKDKIVHRLDAAHSLEKVRQGLSEFDNSLNQIRRDRDDDNEEDERKKKAMVKKESMSDALHVMTPQSYKRNDLSSEEDDEGTCEIFAKIVTSCQELSRAAGDSRGALVDACSRHIMCYACDYAYKDGPQIPCDLIFMREGHDICGDDVHCRSAAAQMHGILRQRAKVTQRANEAVCLSESCVRAYLKRRK